MAKVKEDNESVDGGEKKSSRTNILWIPRKTTKASETDEAENILQQKVRSDKGGGKGHGRSQELKNQRQKEQHQPSQDLGVGSPFCLYTSAPFPPPGRDHK